MEETDAAAIARVRAGECDAFQVLVERHSRALFRMAYRMTGNEQDAEDIVQETFLRAYRQLNRYESRAGFGTWLFSIASHYGLDVLRARGRREAARAGGNPDAGDPLDRAPARDAGPDRLLLSGEVQKTVDSTLAEMSRQERAAFVLRHFEGMSIEQIGGALGIGGNATKQSIFRAVQKLRKALEPLVSWTI